MSSFVGGLEGLKLAKQRTNPIVDQVLIWLSESQVGQSKAKCEETACCVGSDDLDRIQSVDRCFL